MPLVHPTGGVVTQVVEAAHLNGSFALHDTKRGSYEEISKALKPL